MSPAADAKQWMPLAGSSSAGLLALSSMAGLLLTIDAHHSIKFTSGPVLGVKLLAQPNEWNAAFFTWSSDGAIRFWDMDGKVRGRMDVALEQLPTQDEEAINELRVMQASPRGDFVVTGDRVIETPSLRTVYEVKAHHGEILDVTVLSDPWPLLATSGRDRVVQLFRRERETWSLVQTLNEHSASVGGVLFTALGDKLLSCSGDRTIVIRDLASKSEGEATQIAYLPVRTIALKSAPVSMTIAPEMPDTLILSCLDRAVQEFDLPTARQLLSYRTGDQDGNDAVVLDALTVAKVEPLRHPPSPVAGPAAMVAGVSSTDKSIRLYDRMGTLLAREWGHTEGVTSLACVEGPERTVLISTGTDATIMIWEWISDGSSKLDDVVDDWSREASPPKEATAARPPLRRVLSKAELSDFRRPSDPEPNSPLSTPRRMPSPTRSLRKKPSKYALRAGAPTNSLSIASRSYTSPVLEPDDPAAFKHSFRERSPSPQSPRQPHRTLDKQRKASLDTLTRSRAKSAGPANEFGSVNMSTEQVCRTLRAYRKKLGPSSEPLRPENVRALERELGLTIKALGEKVVKTEAVNDEEALVKLLDQYSARLVDLIDRKISGTGTASPSTKKSTDDDSSPTPTAAISPILEEKERGRVVSASRRGSAPLETLGEG
ncbi:MAG: hypothetical protein M1838_004181 [Thelocarpon superellum]|nr:MAG: hypothetical protein M1838_004181 [Thelocarpon superellum]